MALLNCDGCGAPFEPVGAEVSCPDCAAPFDLPPLSRTESPPRGPFLAGFAVGSGLALLLTGAGWLVLLSQSGAQPNEKTTSVASGSPTGATGPTGQEQPGSEARSVEALIAAAEQGDQQGRLLAVEEIGQRGARGRPATPVLLRVIGGRDPALAEAAEKSLGEIRPLTAQELPALREALAAKNPGRVRVAALNCLHDLGTGALPAAGEVVALLGDDDVPVQAEAGGLLRKLGPNLRGELPALLALLGSPDGGTRQRVTEVLSAVRPLTAAEVPTLVKSLDSASEAPRLYAAGALADLGPQASEAAEPLTKLYSDTNPEVRRKAVTAVGSIGPAARSTLSPTMGLLTDKDDGVADAAEAALRRMGPFPAADLPTLRKGTFSNNVRLRRFSAAALVPLRAEARPALSDLTRLLKDEDSDIRINALRALEGIGPDAHEARADVVAALEKAEGEHLRQGTATLVAVGPAQLVDLPLLRPLLKDQRALVRAAAARLLVPVKGEDDAAVVAVLVMHDAHPQARRMGLEAVTEVPTANLQRLAPQFKSSADYHRRGLETGTPQAQAETLRVLKTMGTDGAAALPGVLPLAANGQTLLGKSAIQTLPIIAPTDPQVHRLLVGKLGRPADEEKVAADALVAIGKPAAKALAGALSDPNAKVRLAAAVALRRIGPPAHDDAIDALDERLRLGETGELRAALVAAYRRLKEKE